MKLKRKIATEEYQEDYSDEFQDAIIGFCGGQDNWYSDGFEDEINNYRQLIKFFGKTIVNEEKETDKKIKEAWRDEEEIGVQYSHVKSFRTFTLHSTFVSIHSMYEGRLLECIEILNKYKNMGIVARKKRNNSILNDIEFLLFEITSKIPGLEIAENANERIFYSNIRKKITHYKCYLKQDDELVSKIQSTEYLTLKDAGIGNFKYKFQIDKSIFLTDYLAIIEHDLKLIFRSLVQL